ncbi:hypothetical protein KBZ21_41365, partial [Streptomyces sp. A73]|nr:hypothetical protein [Streptomyces sp. A73]
GAWADVMRLALWVRDGEPPERSRRIECVWRDPATPTVAQQTEPQETVEQPPEGGKTDPWHDPEKARREIEKLRKEAAKYR